jgi:hypothetical protein
MGEIVAYGDPSRVATGGRGASETGGVPAGAGSKSGGRRISVRPTHRRASCDAPIRADHCTAPNRSPIGAPRTSAGRNRSVGPDCHAGSELISARTFGGDIGGVPAPGTFNHVVLHTAAPRTEAMQTFVGRQPEEAIQLTAIHPGATQALA